MKLADYVDPACVALSLRPAPVRELLEQLLEPLVEAGELRDPSAVLDRLARREELKSTGIGGGIAVPHCICEALSRPRVLVGVCPEGTEYHAHDDRPVQLFFLLLSPRDAVRPHVRLLARIARLTRRPGLLEEIRTAEEPEDVVEALRSYERESL